MDAETLKKIVEVLNQHQVTDFELELEGTKIKLSRVVGQVVGGTPTSHVAIQPHIQGSDAAQVASNGSTSATEDLSHMVKVDSPIVGTFYRKPSPDADSFVNVGDRVKKGQTLCIIEAMKLMNEIEAPCEGKISKILLDDAQVVEFGETLFLIEP